MTKAATVLFEKCPLCSQAKITMEPHRRFSFSVSKIKPCPMCSAEFAAKGVDSYQLVFCDPHKVVGNHQCADRVFRGCYLGATLSKSEWQKIAEGGESDAFSKFLDMSKRFQQGSLPTYPSHGLPFVPEKDEVVHYFSSPVYLNEKQPSYGKSSDKGDFILTSRRIVIVHQTGTLSIPFERMERVEECPLGFSVKDEESFEPFFFFPPPYDPVFAALLGAIYNFKGLRQRT